MFFFDIETTGLPKTNKKDKRNKYYPPEFLYFYESSRIVSISWMIYDEEGNLLKKEYHIVKPDGFVSHPKALEVHNITNEMAEAEGKPIKDIFSLIKSDLNDQNIMLGYNVAFDYHILLSEAYRYHDRELTQSILNKRVVCIQRESINNIENLKCRYKFYPKMEEVVRHLFNKENFSTTHNALDDTFQCAKIYFYLKNKKIIEL